MEKTMKKQLMPYFEASGVRLALLAEAMVAGTFKSFAILKISVLIKKKI